MARLKAAPLKRCRVSLNGSSAGGPMKVSQIRTAAIHKANTSTLGRSKPLGSSMSEYCISRIGGRLDTSCM
jgi:hypothetical protein